MHCLGWSPGCPQSRGRPCRWPPGEAGASSWSPWRSGGGTGAAGSRGPKTSGAPQSWPPAAMSPATSAVSAGGQQQQLGQIQHGHTGSWNLLDTLLTSQSLIALQLPQIKPCRVWQEIALNFYNKSLNFI